MTHSRIKELKITVVFLHTALKIVVTRAFQKQAASHYRVFMLFSNSLTTSAVLQLISGPLAYE